MPAEVHALPGLGFELPLLSQQLEACSLLSERYTHDTHFTLAVHLAQQAAALDGNSSLTSPPPLQTRVALAEGLALFGR